ncbi:hypothetical protein Tco_0305746, partial [Tanacetum coccineum]
SVHFLLDDWTQFIQLIDSKVSKLKGDVNLKVSLIIVPIDSKYRRLIVGMNLDISDWFWFQSVVYCPHVVVNPLLYELHLSLVLLNVFPLVNLELSILNLLE